MSVAFVRRTNRAPLSAVQFARRIRAKDRWRRKRDRKIAVDWLGKEFVWDAGFDELGQPDRQRLRLVGYNPANHTVAMRLLNTPSPEAGCGLWDTDAFWQRLWSGKMVRN